MDEEFNEVALLRQPIRVRSPLEMARILVMEAPNLASDVAAAAHQLACQADDEDGALFWSDVLLLVM